MKFGDNLKQIRKSKNISQEELAERLGVSRQSISKWETGENYPSMFNIMCLCDIFKCKINNLVHESMSDINSLDEEVKMSVVKFKEDKQKKMKGLSKAISIICKIGKVALIVGVVAIILAVFTVPIVGFNIKSTNPGEVKVFNRVVKYDRTDKDKIVITYKKDKSTITDTEEVMAINKVFDYIEDNNLTKVVIFSDLALVCLIVTLVLAYKTLDHLDKLFTNIHSGDTPFTMDNVMHIKKMAWLAIWLIIFPTLTGIFAELIMGLDLDIGFEGISLLTILLLFSLSYIFEYGYQIQLDSKGVMYDEKQ